MLGILFDVFLDGTIVGDEEKLCIRSVYRFKSAEDTGERTLQDSVLVFMTPKQDLLESQALDADVLIVWTTSKATPTATRNNFAAGLKPRGACCTFTDIDASMVAAHIIPFNKQEESTRQLPTVVYSLSSIMWPQILAGNQYVDPYHLNAD